MRTSQNGLDLIKKYEGCQLKAYLCPAGVWTIGYGHTGSDVKEGLVILQSRADEYLKSDLETAEHAITAYCLHPLTQNQFDALASFVFNIGTGNFKSSTLLKRINANMMGLAAFEFPKWNKAKGKVLQGLVDRRESERQLFLKKG